MLASVTGGFQPGLCIRLITRFHIPRKWHIWLLTTYSHQVDISACAYRCMRAIGGSWTGQKGCIQTKASWNSLTIGPVLRVSHTAPAPSVGSCRAALAMSSCHPLHDDMEAELVRLTSPAQRLPPARARSPTEDDGRRWPTLAKWQCLVPMCTYVKILALSLITAAPPPV